MVDLGTALQMLPPKGAYKSAPDPEDVDHKSLNTLRRASPQFPYLGFALRPDVVRTNNTDRVLSLLQIPDPPPIEVLRTESKTKNPRTHDPNITYTRVGFALASHIRERWNMLEDTLISIYRALLDHGAKLPYSQGLSLPLEYRLLPPPCHWGYHKTDHPNKQKAVLAVRRAREAFVMLMAALCYVVALHERRWPRDDWETEIRKRAGVFLRPGEPYDDGTEALTVARCLNRIFRSGFLKKEWGGHRTGVIVHPGCDWANDLDAFVAFGVPVWVEWGTIDFMNKLWDERGTGFIKDRLVPLFPARDLVDAAVRRYEREVVSPHPLAHRDSAGPSKRAKRAWSDGGDATWMPNDTSSHRADGESALATLDSTASAPLSAWSAHKVHRGSRQRPGETPREFFANQKKRADAIIARETPAEKKARESREEAFKKRGPGSRATNVTVWIWERANEDNTLWTRTPVVKGAWESTFQGYDRSQWKYDSATNEFDIWEDLNPEAKSTAHDDIEDMYYGDDDLPENELPRNTHLPVSPPDDAMLTPTADFPAPVPQRDDTSLNTPDAPAAVSHPGQASSSVPTAFRVNETLFDRFGVVMADALMKEYMAESLAVRLHGR
jgi:hypothetical protein